MKKLKNSIPITMRLSNHIVPLPDVDRVEVIDEKGRSYVNWDKNNEVQISLQDDRRTLKIFISKNKNN